MIGRPHHVVLDCPNPRVLAEFYSELLGRPVTYATDGFCVVAVDERSSGIAFQRVDDFLVPTWPNGPVPQQVHLDVMVDDVEAAAQQVIELGARQLQDTVYADPAGHPFCLIPLPEWAPPVTAG